MLNGSHCKMLMVPVNVSLDSNKLFMTFEESISVPFIVTMHVAIV